MHRANLASHGLEGQVAVVTGGGRGVGRAIALALAEAGAQVVVSARTRSELDETVSLVSQVGRSARAVEVDVTSRPAVERLVGNVLAETGRIDILVNCAGSFVSLDPVWEADSDRWWQDVTTNLYGTFLCCRSVLPGMIERREGTIINLSGGGADAAAPYWSGYGSSKAALLRFTESLAGEVAAHGIRVYAMGPGLVRTAMTESLLQDPRIAEYAPWFPAAFDRGADVPPEEAGRLAVQLATLRDPRLSGRVFAVGANMNDIVSQAATIAADDLYTLRVRKPPPR